MPHVIEEWHAFKLSATEAELTLLGSGFGSQPGEVKIIVKGAGQSYPQIKKWSDKAIITECPVDSEVMVAFVDIPDSRGKKDRQRTDPSQARSSTGPAPGFLVTNVEAGPDELTLQGSNLDLVDQVILYDDDIPQLVEAADFVFDSGELLVQWPANFSGNIERLRAVNEENEVQEVQAPPGGWAPAEPGLVSFLQGSRNAAGEVLLTINGIDLGATAGTVSLTTATGTSMVLVKSWSDSSVVVFAQPKTVYTGVTLVADNGLTADVSPTAPLPVKTPGLEATISTIVQTGSNPETFRISGTNLDHVSDGSIDMNVGVLSFYSDDAAFHDTGAAALNSAGGTTSVTFASGQIDVTASADLSGRLLEAVQLNDLNGALNSSLDAPDFVIAGAPGSPTAIVTSTDTVFRVGFDPSVEDAEITLLGSGLGFTPGHVTATNKNGDAVILNPSTGPTAIWNPTFVRVAGEPGERYTDVQLVLSDASLATMNQPETWSQIGGPVPTITSITSPSPKVLRIEGDFVDAVWIWSFILRPGATGAGGVSQNAYNRDVAEHDAGPNSAALPTGVEYSDSLNTQYNNTYLFTPGVGDAGTVDITIGDYFGWNASGMYLHQLGTFWWSVGSGPSAGSVLTPFKSTNEGGTDSPLLIA